MGYTHTLTDTIKGQLLTLDPLKSQVRLEMMSNHPQQLHVQPVRGGVDLSVMATGMGVIYGKDDGDMFLPIFLSPKIVPSTHFFFLVCGFVSLNRVHSLVNVRTKL